MAAQCPVLTSPQLEALVAPFVGAPSQLMPAIFDATASPADVMDAAMTMSQPNAQPKSTWHPSVQFLAQNAPQALGILARDMAATAALGEVYRAQPNEVWRAYGVASVRARPTAQGAPAPARDEVVVQEAQPASGRAAPQPPPSETAPSAAPQAAAPAPAAAPEAAAAAPAGTVVYAAPPEAASGGVARAAVGLGVGMLVGGAIANNDGDWDDWDNDDPPYGNQPPYGGAYAGNAAAAQQSRQNYATQAREDRQANQSQSQADRQANRDQTRQERQDTAQGQQSQRQQQRNQQTVNQAAAGGQRPAAGARPQGTQPVTAADRRPQAGAGGSWGPAQGMDNTRTERTRSGGGGGAAARTQGQRAAPTGATQQRGGGGATQQRGGGGGGGRANR